MFPANVLKLDRLDLSSTHDSYTFGGVKRREEREQRSKKKKVLAVS